MQKIPSIILAIITLSTIASAANNSSLEDAQTAICGILERIYDLLVYVASGIGAVMVVIYGLIWVSSADNSKARTSAKQAVTHVVVGLIIISIATTLVAMVIGEGASCIDMWS